MHEKTWMRFSSFQSDNRKSKTCPEPRRRIENLKWVGIVVIGFTFAMCGAVAQAQQTGKIFLIGLLDRSTGGSAVHVDAFRQELSKLGWIEGKNITIEYRFAEGRTNRLPELAAELVRLKVDLIVTTGRVPALAAKSATTTIPIVMMGNPDPVGEGLVASLARPGGNVTGFSGLGMELGTKRLEILRDAVPKLTRVGVLRQVTRLVPGDLPMKDLRAAAPLLKLKLEEIETEAAAKGLERAFRTAKQKQVGAIMTGGGRLFFSERKRIVELAGKYRLPAIYPQKEFVDEGGLMSYGTDTDHQYRLAAVYVDKIFKGAKPADLPVQQPMKFEFVINLKAVKQINLTIPPEVFARANRVIR
jgi:putative ABC transport system substrate-binding protein